MHTEILKFGSQVLSTTVACAVTIPVWYAGARWFESTMRPARRVTISQCRRAPQLVTLWQCLGYMIKTAKWVVNHSNHHNCPKRKSHNVSPCMYGSSYATQHMHDMNVWQQHMTVSDRTWHARGRI